MRNFIKLILSFFLLSLSFQFFGQMQTDSNSQFANGANSSDPSSKVDSNVDLATGAVKYDIPLATIAGDNVSIPINLSYKSSGVKVDEYTSWAGLGWDLDIPYNIKRKVIGLPDNSSSQSYPFGVGAFFSFGSQDFTLDPYDLSEEGEFEISPNFYTSQGYPMTTLQYSAISIMDLQLDEYYFSLPNYSGMFVINPLGENQPQVETTKIYQGKSFVLVPNIIVPYANLNVYVEFSMENEITSFLIVSPENTSYLFEAIGYSAALVTKFPYRYEQSFDNGILEQKNDYFLTSISNEYNEEEIEITYISSNDPEFDQYFDGEDWGINISPEFDGIIKEDLTYTLEIDNSCGNDDNWCEGNYEPIDHPRIKKEYHTIVHPSSITSKFGSIQFLQSNSNRLDIPTDHSLEKLVVTNELGQIQLTYLFMYRYTGSQDQDYRLVLDEVRLLNDASEEQNLYSFEYYEDHLLPEYSSFSTDHWGYYNGSQNSTSFPYTEYFEALATIDFADRNPNVEFGRSQMIRAVTNAGGKRTEFEYESNSYSKLRGSELNENKIGGGLRVKKISLIDISANTPSIEYNIDYNEFGNQTSSGNIEIEPNYEIYTSALTGGVVIESSVNGNYSMSYGCFECFSHQLSSISQYYSDLMTMGLPIYKEVRVGVQNAGSTYYRFEKPSINNSDLNFPFIPILFDGNSVRLTEKKIFNSQEALISSEQIEYENVYPSDQKVMSVKTMRIPGISDMIYKYKEYYYTTSAWRPVRKTSKMYDQLNDQNEFVNVVEMTYDQEDPNIITETFNYSTDPNYPISATKIKFVKDYAIEGSGSDQMTVALDFMINTREFGLSAPVETITLRGSSVNDLKVVGGVINTFKIVDDKVRLDATYQLELLSPLDEASFTFSSVIGNEFSMHNSYRKIASILEYDSDERPIAIQKENDIHSTVIRDYADGRGVAGVVNANPNECAYTSFETDNGNGWIYNQNDCYSVHLSHLGFWFAIGYTGNRYYEFHGVPIQSNSMPAGKYKVTFWTRNPGVVNVTASNGAVVVTNFSNINDGPPIWKYHEYTINASNSFVITISGGEWTALDELRIHPEDATMSTTSFNNDGTVVSTCDVNNRTKRFLYDSWKRLEWTLDDNWQILTHHEYHIKDLNNSNDHSWIKEQVVMAEGMTRAAVLNASANDESVITSITYSDGFGRPLQSLVVRQNPEGNKDLVTFHNYDANGREVKKFLPFVSDFNNDGDFINNPLTELLSFYNSTPLVAQTDFPFAETEYEASPIGRPLRQGNVGQEWQLNTDHTINTQTLLNDENEVLIWGGNQFYASAMDGDLPKYYPANTLIKKQVEDEHGQKSWEYINALGQVVCVRTKSLMSGDGSNSYSWTNGSGNIGDEFLAFLPGTQPSEESLDSYFVYDSFGRLIYELPPIFILSCNGNFQFQVNQGGNNYSSFDGYASAYHYDHRGRLVENKKPGEGWSEYVYNNLNQIILSKSPELSADDDKWNFVKYDVIGRTVQTGLFTSTNSRAILQQELDLTNTNLWETKSGDSTSPYNGASSPSNNVEVLTETYYDDYIFDINGYTYGFGGTPVEVQAKRTKGAVTGSKVKILGNVDGEQVFLTTVNYYDSNGRLSVQFYENLLGGFDKILNEYDYSGKVTKSTRHFRKAGAESDQLTIVDSFEYDRAGRPTKTKQKIGNNEEVIISRLEYNQLGQVVKKHLHIAGETNSGMQIVDYRYNERGWITKINNADLVNDGDNLESYDVFGEELIYHEEDRFYSTVLDMSQQFNGNIGAIKWKTNIAPDALDGSTMAGHSYVFRYDNLGQMLGAFYAQSKDTYIDNYSFKAHSWDEKASYDANGNVLSMMRMRSLDEHGIEYSTPQVMDMLSYTYISNSNKILSIQDNGQDDCINNASTNPYSHFIDNTAVGSEYTYDEEGRTLTDLNKGISFEYNHLDLVKRASEGAESVNFTWDATGQKLKKQVGTSITYYFNGIEYSENFLTQITTAEGISRPADNSNLSGLWFYDYYLKDHLGNVRAVVTNENSELLTEIVTVELNSRAEEDMNFDNVSATEKDKPFQYPYDPVDPTSQKVTELSALTGKIIGPAKLICIEAGEKIDLSTKFWYTEVPGDPLSSVSEIIAGTLLNLGAASSGIIPSGPESGMALINNVNGSQFGAFSSFLSDEFQKVDFSNPQAYIVYMCFDKKMNLDASNSGIVQVGEANSLGQLSKSDIRPRSDGYFYTYVTNRSGSKVNFDNLTIKRWAPMVRVVYNYYPYGLTWENPKLPSDADAIHDCAYQDKEFQFAEFSTGHGLALYDFHARMYDPASSRWLVPDPAAQFYNPYLAMGNSPVNQIDPTGTFSDDLDGWVQGANSNWFWDDQATEDNYLDLHPDAIDYSDGGVDFIQTTTNKYANAGDHIYLGEHGYWYILNGEGRMVLGEGQIEEIQSKGINSKQTFGGTYDLVPYNAALPSSTLAYDVTPRDVIGLESWSKEQEWQQFHSDFNEEFAFYMNGELRAFLDEVAITEAGIAIDLLTAGGWKVGLRGASLIDDAAKGGRELFNFAKAAADHMATRGRKVPIQILDEVIKSSVGLPDPKGSQALMYYSQMWKNGKLYNLEVLYDIASNAIWHFEYAREAMGPLLAIPK